MATCMIIQLCPSLLHKSPRLHQHNPLPCPLRLSHSSNAFSTCYIRPKHPNFRFHTRASNEGDTEDLSSKVEHADWRSFRARLLRSNTSEQWAHALVQPECGCLLLAHPDLFTLTQHYFHQSVILLFAHGNEGSAGLILNRPTEYKLGQLAGFEDFLPEFQNCPLYMGGDVGVNALHVIHGLHGLEGSKEIISGVYMGGIRSLKEHVESGCSTPMDYRWFVRYAGWGPGQLEREVAAGVWYLACASKDFILQHTVQASKPLWKDILEHMGDPYAGISKRAYGEM